MSEATSPAAPAATPVQKIAGVLGDIRAGLDKARPIVDRARSIIDSIDTGMIGTFLNRIPLAGATLAAVDLLVDACDSVLDVVDNYLDANGSPSTLPPVAPAVLEAKAKAMQLRLIKAGAVAPATKAAA